MAATPPQNKRTEAASSNSPGAALARSKYSDTPNASSSNKIFRVAPENVVKELFPVHRLEWARSRMLSRHGKVSVALRNLPNPNPDVLSTVPLMLRYSTILRAYHGTANSTTGAVNQATDFHLSCPS